jgi:hypothetical protein
MTGSVVEQMTYKCIRRDLADPNEKKYGGMKAGVSFNRWKEL